MSSRWMLTVRKDCDLAELAKKLEEMGISFDPAKRPMPLGEKEQSVTVTVKGSTIPAAAGKLEGVLRVHPSSKMTLF